MVNLYGVSTGAIWCRFSNTAAVEVLWNASLFGQVDHREIKPPRLALGAPGRRTVANSRMVGNPYCTD